LRLFRLDDIILVMVSEVPFPESIPSDADSHLAAESRRRLSAAMSQSADSPLRLRLGASADDVVELPHAAAQLLIRLLEEMARGNAVTLIPVHAELTTQQAADLLGVSRPFVVREIEERRLPARKVGSHRRIRFEDLIAYKRRSDAARQKVLDDLAELDEKLGLQ
jgi:excisionase family DNA binding protein